MFKQLGVVVNLPGARLKQRKLAVVVNASLSWSKIKINVLV